VRVRGEVNGRREAVREKSIVCPGPLATTFLRKKFSGMSEVATEPLASGQEPQRVLLQGGRGFM
jgi:hypothetical protein